MAVCPQARCYWIDSSEGFLAVAKRPPARYGEQVTFVSRPWRPTGSSKLSVPWTASSRCPRSIIWSGMRRRLFTLAALTCWLPGMVHQRDEMKTLDEGAYRASLDFWVRHIETQATRIPPALADTCRRWCGHFEGWKRRNIERIDQPKTKGDDLHEPFVEQVQWLREIGF